jgi:hypothetical protein
MKIGILTYYCVCNFGAQLQTISTIGYLKRNGYDPIVIHWYPKDLEEIYQKRISVEQYQEHILFVERYMPLTRLCRTEEDIIQVVEENNIDAIIIGSDAVLQYIPYARRKVFVRRKLKYMIIKPTDDKSFPNPYWGCFINKLKNKIPIIGFSMSSQNMPYFMLNSEEIRTIRDALHNFTTISTRDEWTKKMIVSLLDDKVPITITPDPVFAFNDNNFLPIIEKKELLEKYSLPKDYILISFQQPWLVSRISFFWIKSLEYLFKRKGLTSVAFAMPEGIKSLGLKSVIDVPIETLDWYYLIKYSKGYIGERMHPIIVCIHNSVPFFCFDHYGTYYDTKIPLFRKYIYSSSKIYDILNRANLLEYTCSYINLIRRSPKYIFNKIINFDKNKCKIFANNYLLEYKKAMEKAILAIKNNIE